MAIARHGQRRLHRGVEAIGTVDPNDPRRRRYFHSYDSTAEQRRVLIDLVSRDNAIAGIATAVTVYTRRNPEPERQRCLASALSVVAGSKVDAIVVDSRSGALGGRRLEGLDRQDRTTVRRLIRSSHLPPKTNLSFWRDRDEPLLWLPDVVGWTVRDSLVTGEPALLSVLVDVLILVAACDVVSGQAKGTGKSRTRDSLGPPPGTPDISRGPLPGGFRAS